NSYDLIVKPVLSEKSMDAAADKQYTFVVNKNANKTEIRQAVEEIFGVKVESVNTVRTMGKIKRQGRTFGRTPEVKKAIVTLKSDSKGIEFFDSLAQ
ncbi:50S ribosomal protein L23, partial [Luoshenia tenuis]|uniref:50S ribosomal protein L23 n=1 Tax=Luoshenia tenuis TaxID=2763654 RepID=UPI003D8DA7F8